MTIPRTLQQAKARLWEIQQKLYETGSNTDAEIHEHQQLMEQIELGSLPTDAEYAEANGQEVLEW